MAYRELPPPPEIASHVACLWLRTGAGGRVVPDGCADIVWTGADLIVAGPSTQAFVASGLPEVGTKVGARFRVGAAGSVLGLPARALLNMSPRIAEVWRDGEELTARMGEAASAGERLRLLVGALAARVRASGPVDPVVRGAVLEVARPGVVRVGSLGGGVLGERQLRRRFDEAVGYAPKTLAGVLRLQRFLALARRANGGGDDGGGLARLALDAGYSDQAHLTRECGRWTGVTPAVLLADGTWEAGEGVLTTS